jgi:hypothetical protein
MQPVKWTPCQHILVLTPCKHVIYTHNFCTFLILYFFFLCLTATFKKLLNNYITPCSTVSLIIHFNFNTSEKFCPSPASNKFMNILLSGIWISHSSYFIYSTCLWIKFSLLYRQTCQCLWNDLPFLNWRWQSFDLCTQKPKSLFSASCLTKQLCLYWFFLSVWPQHKSSHINFLAPFQFF